MPQEKSCISRVFGLLVFLAIIAVGIWLSIFYFGDRSQLPASLPELPADPLSYLPDLELFHKENPFNETKPGEANKWDDACCGLELTIINALDDVWYTYFDIAVSEWENGTPDALTLTTQQATQPDSECSAETGVMKVCNGDYGETDWKGACRASRVPLLGRPDQLNVRRAIRDPISLFLVILIPAPARYEFTGINTVLLDGRYITASSARMNDHFFTSSTSDNDKRQYTMCHEVRISIRIACPAPLRPSSNIASSSLVHRSLAKIGHGFG